MGEKVDIEKWDRFLGQLSRLKKTMLGDAKGQVEGLLQDVSYLHAERRERSKRQYEAGTKFYGAVSDFLESKDLWKDKGTEAVDVEFGRLDERYVGKSIRAAVQVDRLILHAALRFRFPLMEPGLATSFQASAVDSHVKQAVATMKDIVDKVLDDLRTAHPSFSPGKINYDDPTPPRISLSRNQGTVFIDTYAYIIPKSWKDATGTEHQTLQADIISSFQKQGLESTFYTED